MPGTDGSRPPEDVHLLALEVGGIGVWDWRPGNDTATWSPTWSDLLGLEPEELPTTLAGSLELVHPDDRPTLERRLEDLLGGAEGSHAEYRLRHADGSWRWVRGSASTVMDDDGVPARVVLVVVDGMPERRAVDQAEHRRRLEEVCRRSASALLTADHAAIEPTVVDGLRRLSLLLGADRAALVREDEQTGTWSERLAWSENGPDEDVPALGLPIFPWLMGELSAGRVVCVDRRDALPADADDGLRQRLEDLSLEALCVVPVVVDGHVAAAVKVSSTGPTEWPADAEPMLAAFASSCVQALRRRHLERDLHQAHRHMEHLVDRSPVVMWRLSPHDDTLSYISPNAAEALGIPAELIREAWFARTHPDDVPTVAGAMRQVRSGEEAHFEARFRHGDGRWVTFEVFVRPEVADGGSPAGAVGYSIDVTERKAADEQLRRAQKLEAVGQLAGGVAHDFNNLLTVIHGYIELAQRGDGTALGEALAAAERARSLIERLLTFSRQRDVDTVPVDLNGTIRSMHRMMNLVGRDVDVVLDLAADLPPVVADPGQLEQAVLNLAVNARDAMPAGGTLTLRTDVPGHLPDELAGGHYVRLQVGDTGVGMTPEVAARALDPFFTTKAEGRGTGLGLPAVHGAVTAVGGSLRFDTAPGQGTTFDLFLPVARERPQPVDDTAPPVAEPVDGATVLVVEDQPQLGDLVANVLEHAGHHVLVAPDGPAALGLAEGRHLDLVITDVAMPHMEGPELAAALRVDRSELPVIYMSGYTGEMPRTDTWTWFLQKPFTISQLTDLTATALDRGRR